jgi:hypothetical protein
VGHHQNGYLTPAHDHPLELQVQLPIGHILSFLMPLRHWHFTAGRRLFRPKRPSQQRIFLESMTAPQPQTPHSTHLNAVQIHVAIAGAVAHFSCFASCALPFSLLPSRFVKLLQVQQSDPVSCSAGGVEAAFDKVKLPATCTHQTSARSFLFSCILFSLNTRET